jgi:inosine/xanthosine triphosphatase
VKTIVVASQNPVKTAATLAGFRRMFPDLELEMRSVSVPSGVSRQPMSGEEMRCGADQRAAAAAEIAPQADFWVGIEGGIEKTRDGLLACAWVVVRTLDRVGRGRTGGFLLPEAVAELVRRGLELGEANDVIFGRKNSKQEEGAIGLLTGNVMDRRELYEHGVVLALAPLKSSAIYDGTPAVSERCGRRQP